MSELLLGSAAAVITPPLGTLMAGFGFRDHGAESIWDDLELRLFWLQQGDETMCIVTADVIGFGATATQHIRNELQNSLGIDGAKVLLCASHTHSGPQLLDTVISAGGPLNKDVLIDITPKIVTAVKEAQSSMEAVQLSWGQSSLSGYAINRRRINEDGSVWGPNPFGRRDDAVTAIHFSDAQKGDLKAILFSYTCHPTTLAGYTFSGDYPAATRRNLEKDLGATVGFLPGCFGDVRPNCVTLGKSFRAGKKEDVTAFGEALAESVKDASKSTFSLTPKLDSRCEKVLLPLQKEGESRSLPLQRVDLAQDFSILTMGGEICVDYGHFAKSLDNTRFILPLGYCNDLIAYIPTAQMFQEGGYEPQRSCEIFGLPAPFDQSVEKRLKESIAGIMES